jgi:hypothetical protein
MKKLLIAPTLALALALPAAGLASKTPPNKRAAALKACKAERANIGVAAFELKYGAGKKHENALGKCVSAQLKKKKK